MFIRLEPYRQHSVLGRRNNKLVARYAGPYTVTHKLSPVAYKIDLPADSRIHNVLHISMLKQAVQHSQITDSYLTAIVNAEELLPEVPVSVCKEQHQNKKTYSINTRLYNTNQSQNHSFPQSYHRNHCILHSSQLVIPFYFFPSVHFIYLKF